jgi:hypothetical protein
MSMIVRPVSALSAALLLAAFPWAATVGSVSVARAAPPSLPGAGVAPASKPSLSQAQAFLAAADRAATAAEQTAALASARQQLESLVDKPTSSDELPTANLLLGQVLILQGRISMAPVEQARPEERERLRAQARDHLRRAELAFSAAVEQLKMALDRYPKFLPLDHADHPKAEQIRGGLLQALMAHATVVEELAATFTADSKEANEYYKAAAERYERIYKDYRTRIAGLTARLKQGECCFRMGDTRRALGLYDDILNQPADLELLRRLRVKAMYLSLECWTTEREKLYELAFSQGEEYLTHLRPEEESWTEWHAVRYHTARGYQLAAAGLGADRAADRAEYLDKARNHAEKLAATAGPYQELARSIVGPKQ